MAFEFNFDNLKTNKLSDSSYNYESRIITGKVNSIKNDPSRRVAFRYPAKEVSPYIAVGFDFMELSLFVPTEEELNSYDSSQESLESDYIIARDQNVLDQVYNNNFEFKYPGVTTSIPTLLASPTIYFKDVLFNVNVTRWKQLNQYDGWYRRPNNPPSYPFIGTPSDLMPGVSDVNVLPPVKTAKGLPKTGKPGDIIIVNNDDFSGGSDQWHAWDDTEKKFTRTFYNKYFSRVMDVRQNERNNALQAKGDVILSLLPFLWSGNYIPSYRINRDIL
jgi:hypothetical protein